MSVAGHAHSIMCRTGVASLPMLIVAPLFHLGDLSHLTSKWVHCEKVAAKGIGNHDESFLTCERLQNVDTTTSKEPQGAMLVWELLGLRLEAATLTRTKAASTPHSSFR